MRKRILALALVCLMLPAMALCDLSWPDGTPAQKLLREYVERVNTNLATIGQPVVNAMFECYPTFATLGVVSGYDLSVPDGVELTFSLYNDSLNSLQLRVSDPSRFAALAGSCIQAASPSAITLREAMADPARYAKAATDSPASSFEDKVDTLNGPAPRVYYAYYPNQYRDGVNWLQMTLIFPLAGYGDSGVSATPTPPPQDNSYYDDNAETGYERSDYDGGTHLEVFVTPTPEPDSAAME